MNSIVAGSGGVKNGYTRDTPQKPRNRSAKRVTQKSVRINNGRPRGGRISRSKMERTSASQVRRGLSFAGGPSSIKIGDPSVNPFKKPSKLPFSRTCSQPRQHSKHTQPSTYKQPTKKNQRKHQINRGSDSDHQLKITTLRNVLQIDERTANRVLDQSNGSVRQAMNLVLQQHQQTEMSHSKELQRRNELERIRVF